MHSTDARRANLQGIIEQRDHMIEYVQALLTGKSNSNQAQF
jgi:hypothetical protein